MTPIDHRIDGRDWALLGVLSVLWGGSFFFNGVALKELPPFTLVFLRVALAALILLPVLRVYRIDFPKNFRAGGHFLASRSSTTCCRSR
jgi:drug/metabolite transporter (DMT)-like permease